MKTQEELREELNRAYMAAHEQMGVDNWTSFAKLVNIPYPTIYRIVSEKSNLTSTTLRRIYTELAIKGVNVDGSDIALVQNNAQNISAPVKQTTTDARWFTLCAEKDKQIDRLLGIIEKMQK